MSKLISALGLEERPLMLGELPAPESASGPTYGEADPNTPPVKPSRRAWDEQVGADIDDSDVEERAQELIVERKRHSYIEALRRVKKFQLFRDRLLAESQAAANREEQEQFDRTATQFDWWSLSAEFAARDGRLRQQEVPPHATRTPQGSSPQQHGALPAGLAQPLLN